MVRGVAFPSWARFALERLNVLAGALMIGAHPDDEHTEVLAFLARLRRARTAYLSLTRGEGGQNLLGPEQGELLGVLRTQELLAARAIDGAEQYFTRAIDFGYSRSVEDTLSKWGPEAVLGDIVWLVRRLRPDVIIQTVEGSSSGRHAHHRAADHLAAEAFERSGDVRCYPEHLRLAGPWRATRLFRVVAGVAPEGPAIQVDATRADPMEGVPLAEIARRSRGMHRSQGFDSPARRIPPRCWLVLVAGEPVQGDVFDHVDTTWNRLAGGAAVGRRLEQITRQFDPERPEALAESLAGLRPLMAAMEDPRAQHKLRELDDLVARCLGASMAVFSRVQHVVPGAALEASPEGRDEQLTVAVPPDQPYSQPYWLRKPRGPYLYSVDGPEAGGPGGSPPPVTVRLPVKAGGQEIAFERPVVGPAAPESPVAVVPRVSLGFPEQVHLFADGGSRTVTVSVRSHCGLASGHVALQAPAGWTAVPRSIPFQASEDAGPVTLGFHVTPPSGDSRQSCHAVAVVGDRQISCRVVEIAYPDLPRQIVLEPAAAVFLRADVRVAARGIGYVMGPGDRVPEALRQMGCAVTLLDERELSQGNLGRFDAIVTGVRAFNVRSDLRANRSRLLEYMEAGGAWIVQYNVADRRAPEQVAGIGPYFLRIARDRVVSADAPVALLDPAHPLLCAPNRISAMDFRGWVQERGLYFAAEWDSRYSPLFECHDPGERPLEGATLCARYGQGVYVFTALSWFRQLPAGVGGAWRVFANLVSAARTLSGR